jgi:hypothetical protein
LAAKMGFDIQAVVWQEPCLNSILWSEVNSFIVKLGEPTSQPSLTWSTNHTLTARLFRHPDHKDIQSTFSRMTLNHRGLEQSDFDNSDELGQRGSHTCRLRWRRFCFRARRSNTPLQRKSKRDTRWKHQRSTIRAEETSSTFVVQHRSHRLLNRCALRK